MDGQTKTTGLPLARLRWQTPEGAECEYPLTREPVAIGRLGESTVTLPDSRVSRRHAEISYDSSGFHIADLGSANGTFVNGQRIEGPRRLCDGDRIRVGPVELCFQLVPAPATAPEPEPPTRATIVVAEPATQPCLEVSCGPQRGTRFGLSRDRTVIGRAGHGPRWDVTLQDRAVSRPHAEIVRREGAFVLSDLQSANGTLVNGAVIVEPHSLKEGDALTIGETVLIFHQGTA